MLHVMRINVMTKICIMSCVLSLFPRSLLHPCGDCASDKHRNQKRSVQWLIQPLMTNFPLFWCNLIHFPARNLLSLKRYQANFKTCTTASHQGISKTFGLTKEELLNGLCLYTDFDLRFSFFLSIDFCVGNHFINQSNYLVIFT